MLIIDAGVTSAGVAVIVVAILAVVVVAMLSATLHGIYSAALYQYAVGGETGVFSERGAGRGVPGQGAARAFGL